MWLLFVPDETSLDESAVRSTITGSEVGGLVGPYSIKFGWESGAIFFAVVAGVVAGRRVNIIIW